MVEVIVIDGREELVTYADCSQIVTLRKSQKNAGRNLITQVRRLMKDYNLKKDRFSIAEILDTSIESCDAGYDRLNRQLQEAGI